LNEQVIFNYREELVGNAIAPACPPAVSTERKCQDFKSGTLPLAPLSAFHVESGWWTVFIEKETGTEVAP
jgi:hypothetical protein